MRPQITGHSGCRIDIVREDGHLVVHKMASGADYTRRLLRQADKQKEFLTRNRLPYVTAPKILRRVEEGDVGGMVMEYVHGRTFIDYFENATYLSPRRFAEQMVEFLQAELAISPMQEVPSDLIPEKFRDVSRVIRGNSLLANDPVVEVLLERAGRIFLTPRKRIWPLGNCHGDLTLSNILFQEGRLYLIDFLDSFLETPLMDLVKLRQDTRHLWSQMMYRGQFDKVKNTLILRHIDKILWDVFSKAPWVQDGYGEMQCLSFLRILQYAKEECVIHYLTQELERLLQECGV